MQRQRFSSNSTNLVQLGTSLLIGGALVVFLIRFAQLLGQLAWVAIVIGAILLVVGLIRNKS